MENTTHNIDSIRDLKTGLQYIEVTGLINFLNIHRKETKSPEVKETLGDLIVSLSTMKPRY